MILLHDYLTHWQINYPDASVPNDELTDDMRKDAQVTVDLANELLERFGHERGLASGWRPLDVNRRVPGASAHSNHCLCRAVDIADPGNALDGWLSANPEILDELGLWRESPSKSPNWCHLQIVPNASWQPGKSRTYNP